MAEHASTLAALMLLFGATTATAQTGHPATPGGAYEAMSPGNQNVARALHEAQMVTPITPGSTGSRKPLSLEQISQLKRANSGWGQVLKEMQRRGLLLKERTLAQIVNRYNQTAHPVATAGHRAAPKVNGEQVARGGRPNEASAAPAAIVGAITTPESAGPDADPRK
jgi:hypothetical protein